MIICPQVMTREQSGYLWDFDLILIEMGFDVSSIRLIRLMQGINFTREFKYENFLRGKGKLIWLHY